MIAALGTGGPKGNCRQWRPKDLVEFHARINIGDLKHGVLVSGQNTCQLGSYTLPVEQFWFTALRGASYARWYFLCPCCGSRRWHLYQMPTGFMCKDCAGLDWASRHRNRWRGGPAIARFRKLRAKLAARRHKTSSYYRLAAAIAAAEDELLGSAKCVTRDLKRRERNGRHRS